MSNTIETVTILNGHTAPESAYLVDDYPFGFRLRCKIRYWIHEADKGAKKGERRFMSQTTNPKVAETVWNKPKGSTYYSLAVMYLDGENHVQHTGMDFWVYPETDARWRHSGIVDQLTARDRAMYEALLAMSQKTNPRTWTEWTDHVTAVAEHIRETGDAPEFVNGAWTDGNGRLRYGTSDRAALVAEARTRLA